MSGAARVYVTLDELTAMLELPEGHYVLALGELPDGHVPGLAVTIAHGDDVRPTLPHYKASKPLLTMDLAQYRRWGSGHLTTRTALRPVETGCADDCIHPSHRHHEERDGRPGRRADAGYVLEGYIPATAPVMSVFTQEVTQTWPKFPGQDLPISGHADPGDEDIHTGGPR